MDNNISISKICCGQFHSLLLSSEGAICAFGDNSSGQIGKQRTKGTKDQLKPTKINHVKTFFYISSHSSEEISMALSFDNIYYIWGNSIEKHILMPMETKFKSSNELFSHNFGYGLEQGFSNFFHSRSTWSLENCLRSTKNINSNFNVKDQIVFVHTMTVYLVLFV
jgi:hypothetical protein